MFAKTFFDSIILKFFSFDLSLLGKNTYIAVSKCLLHFSAMHSKKNKNDLRSGGAVKEVCPYICIKHIIKL